MDLLGKNMINELFNTNIKSKALLYATSLGSGMFICLGRSISAKMGRGIAVIVTTTISGGRKTYLATSGKSL